MDLKVPKEVKRVGYTFKWVKSGREWHIYEQLDGKRIVGWEVVRLYKKFDKYTGEILLRYPSSEQWGKHGFTLMSFKRALGKFKELEGEKV